MRPEKEFCISIRKLYALHYELIKQWLCYVAIVSLGYCCSLAATATNDNIIELQKIRVYSLRYKNSTFVQFNLFWHNCWVEFLYFDIFLIKNFCVIKSWWSARKWAYLHHNKIFRSRPILYTIILIHNKQEMVLFSFNSYEWSEINHTND